MSYLSQVDAMLWQARRFFALAEQAAEKWPDCGSALARAMEHATCAVFMAWGEPRAPEKKMHRFFDDRLAEHIDPVVAEFVRLLWEREGRSNPDGDINEFLAGCGKAIKYLSALAKSPSPANWEPLPIPVPVGWNGLSDDERQFLREVLTIAEQCAPGIRLILFGSRAVGTARPDSDYDLFFIFPNQTAGWQRGQRFDQAVTRLAIDHGVELSIEKDTKSEWLNPAEVNRPLFERIKATGIEVAH